MAKKNFLVGMLIIVLGMAFVGCTDKTITVDLNVTNDRDGKIHGAFANVLSDLDIKIGGNKVRYVLDVDVTISPVDMPTNPNKFARINVDANLTDTKKNTLLLPFNFSLREGHVNEKMAEERCFTYAAKKIDDDYKELLSDCLSKMK